MSLEGFNVTLDPLHVEDLELVRRWRNSEHIKKYALNQEEITKEQQKKWFEKVSKSSDEYFVIKINDEKCGVIWYNLEDNSVMTGFYIYDEKLQNSLTPFKVVSVFHDYLFNKNRFEAIFCKIMPSNRRAIRFNEALGYKKLKVFESYSLYKLTYENYKKADKKIKKLLKD